MKLVPVPVAGVPLAADHENVKVPLPPEAVALHVTGLPVVAELQSIVTVIASGATVMSWEVVAETPLVSVAVKTTCTLVVAMTL